MIAYPIVTAIQSKNCSALRKAIVDGVALDGRDEDGRTALWLTFERGETVPAGPTAGDRVRHKKFGEGAVTHVAGSGEEAKLTIAFDSGDERTLVARFVERL